MTAATTLVWETAGKPAPFGAKADLLKPIPGICAVTGERLDVTADINRALGDNFTDRSMFAAPHSDRVGEATLWACSGKGTSTRPIVRLLTDPPEGEWLLSVAVSAQKHVIPYARVNRGRTWTVRVESTDVSSTSDEWAHVHTTATSLRRLGVGPDDILAGRPGLIRDRDALTQWRNLADRIAAYTGSPLLDLALWTTIGVSKWWARAQTALETAAAGAENAGHAVTIASRKLQIETLSAESAATVARVAPIIDKHWQEWAQTVARESVYIVALARVARDERKQMALGVSHRDVDDRAAVGLHATSLAAAGRHSGRRPRPDTRTVRFRARDWCMR